MNAYPMGLVWMLSVLLPLIIICGTRQNSVLAAPFCTIPSSPEHETYHCRGHWLLGVIQRDGDTCTVQCKDGYELEDGRTTVTIVCKNGHWSRSTKCTAKKGTAVTTPACSDPPSVQHGIYDCVNTTHTIGSYCTLYCSKRHQVSGNEHVFCTDKGNWTTPGSCIDSQCPPPPRIQHGLYVCPFKFYPHGTGCYLQCEGGYRPVSDNINITCRQDETWSPSTSCMDGCLAGSYSQRNPSGETSCEECPKGTYQPDVDKTSCIPCPAGWTTVTNGAVDVNSCTSMCHPGTASSTGVEPCHLCPPGTYQNATGGLTCPNCPSGLTTKTVGSTTCISAQ